MLVIDFGVMFPTDDMAGVEFVLPDTTWLASRAADIEGIVITHGHEDHIGGLTYLFDELAAGGATPPLFASPFTVELIADKLNAKRTKQLNVLADGERRRVGPFDVEVLAITHSVPQSLCVVLHTPQGPLIHTGDFKLDPAPVDGRLTDLARLRQLGDEGVRLLMADSTNADLPGRSAAETKIGETLRRLIDEHPSQRVIAACFASHIHRVQQLAEAAVAAGRVVVPVGRSMVANVQIAKRLGLLTVPDAHWRAARDLDDLAEGEVLVVCTGAQGEPFAALSQLATQAHADLAVGDGDVVILSSHPIPGNERAVLRVINRLCHLGAKVVHSAHEQVHTSGHARRDELTELHQVVRPEWFVPIEGEHHMLVRHAELARAARPVPADGREPDKVLVLADGDQLEITDDGAAVVDRVPTPHRFVQGPVDDVTAALLAERRRIGTDGVVSIAVGIARRKRGWQLASEPEVRTVGWVDAHLSAALVDELVAELERTATGAAAKLRRDEADEAARRKVSKRLRRAAGEFIANRTRRKPTITVTVLTLRS